MPIITAITAQSKNIDRANLFVDNKFYCGIAKILVGSHKLKVGQEISLKQLDELIFESDKEKAFLYAMNYISRYTSTKKQLANKLYEKGYLKQIVDYVVEKTEKFGYINDLDYAKCYIEYNKRLKGKVRLKSELKAKGISSEILAIVLEDFEDNSNSVYDLAKKHSKNKDINDPNYVAKLNRYLAYKGFDWSAISSCIEKLKNNEE